MRILKKILNHFNKTVCFKLDHSDPYYKTDEPDEVCMTKEEWNYLKVVEDTTSQYEAP